MPELPEVETYVRELEPLLHGRSVTAAKVNWARTIAAPGAAEFQARIVGRTFVRFGRRGKYMLFGLDNHDSLIVHLRMTGRLFVTPPDGLSDKHIHVTLDLDDNSRLHFQDSRKFGRWWLVSDATTVLSKLGPEPLEPEFAVETLIRGLGRRKASVKALLLDQALVAGIGNIYADEALFRARIHPARSGSSLNRLEVEQLHEAIRSVLAAGIAASGSSLGSSDIQNYVRPGGERGGFQEEHSVFRRTGEPCRRCGTPIRRVVLAQRSTHFCPMCQPWAE